MGALSYISVLVFIPLITQKNSPFVQFHAKQGLALFIVEVVGFLFVWTIILSWIGGAILFVCGLVSLYGIINAVSGNKTKIPGLYHIVDKLNF